MIDKRKLIGNKIKRARQEANLTQEQLAQQLFMQRSVLSKIENGKYSVAADRLGNFSRALNKKIIYFLSDI
jgi:transcriptional regulator with XRE-family HTH domain